jgi:prophage DNA circulation protein
MKDKKRLNDAFYNKLDELYEQMQIDKTEKASIQFRTKLDRMIASENGMDLLSRESDHYKKMIDEINGRVRTYDNNLGFFKTSKGNTSFLKEIEDKISAEKSKLAELTAKRKMINEELGKVRDAGRQKTEA